MDACGKAVSCWTAAAATAGLMSSGVGARWEVAGWLTCCSDAEAVAISVLAAGRCTIGAGPCPECDVGVVCKGCGRSACPFAVAVPAGPGMIGGLGTAAGTRGLALGSRGRAAGFEGSMIGAGMPEGCGEGLLPLSAPWCLSIDCDMGALLAWATLFDWD